MRTIKDAYNLPRIDETLERLKGSCVFSSLDLNQDIGKWKLKKKANSIQLLHWDPLVFSRAVVNS